MSSLLLSLKGAAINGNFQANWILYIDRVLTETDIKALSASTQDFLSNPILFLNDKRVYFLGERALKYLIVNHFLAQG